MSEKNDHLSMISIPKKRQCARPEAVKNEQQKTWRLRVKVSIGKSDSHSNFFSSPRLFPVPRHSKADYINVSSTGHPINLKAVVKDLPVHVQVYFAKEHRLQIIGRLYNKDEAASSTLHYYYTAVGGSLVQ